jgi:hypothetical protein
MFGALSILRVAIMRMTAWLWLLLVFALTMVLAGPSDALAHPGHSHDEPSAAPAVPASGTVIGPSTASTGSVSSPLGFFGGTGGLIVLGLVVAVVMTVLVRVLMATARH